MNIPEITVKVKFDKYKKSELTKISTSTDIYEIAKKTFNADTIEWTESIMLYFLDRSNKVIGYYKLSNGGIAATLVDPKVVFTMALHVAGTCAIILCHNHPSGNITPSDSDIKISQIIKTIGKLLEIELLDHLIISNEGFYSMSDEGVL